jgi:WD40 repeat protein
LAVVGGKGIQLLDLQRKVVTGTLDNKAPEIGCTALNHDNTRLAVAGDKGVVQVWELASRRVLYEVRGDSYAVAFAPGGQLLATLSGDAIRLWDATIGRENLILRGHGGGVRALAFSPDGLFLASAGVDQTVRVWDVLTGLQQRVYRGHTAPIHRVVYRPDGARLASADQAGVIKVWGATQDRRVLELGPAMNTTSIAFSADGRGVVAAWPYNKAALDGAISEWELPSGRQIVEQPVLVARRTEWPLQYINLSHDGRLFAAPSANDPTEVRVSEVATGREVALLRGHPGRVRTLVFSRDGRRLAVASGDRYKDEPRDVFIWQLPEAGQTAQDPLVMTPPAPVQGLAFSADGSLLIAGERGTLNGATWKDGFVSVWGADSGLLVRRWLAHSGTVQTVAIEDTSGHLVVSGGRGQDHSVRVWDMDSGAMIHDLRGPENLTSVTFSPDGKRLAAVGYEGTVYLWDPDTGQSTSNSARPPLATSGWRRL